MNKTVKIGIVGVGNVARGRHIPELLKCADAEIVAICDVDPISMAKAREMVSLPDEKCYTDYKDLIADPDVDAVEICTPNYLHAEMAISALEAGKPVNLEKPIALNYEEACRIAEAERNSAAFGMTCFTYRYMPAVRYAKKLVDDGILGQIIGLNVAYLQSGALWEGRRLEWRFDKSKAGSGVASDLGSHLIDMAQLLAGPISELCATAKTVIKERMTLDGSFVQPVLVDDCCSFLTRSQDGAESSFHITKCAVGHGNTIKYDLFGSKGSISFNLNDPSVLTYTVTRGDVKTSAKTETVKVPAEYYLTQEQGFINAVKGNRPAMFPTLSDGAAVQRVIDAVLLSAEKRCWVTVSEGCSGLCPENPLGNFSKKVSETFKSFP